MVAGSLLFDGVDDHVEVNDTPGLNFGPGQDLSIDAWINTTSILRQAIVHKKRQDVPTLPGYSFDTGGGVLFFQMADY